MTNNPLTKTAIRAHMGDWVYYVSVLTFSEVKQYVKRIDQELHRSKTLSDMLQRSITDNVDSIKQYILTQQEHFFDSLVLAVYDGDPKWIEVELKFPESEHSFYDLGFLKFSGDEKIFPIDGQHRVEGIKKALDENPDLKDEKITVIFIGHKSTQYGMERSRRLFSTLNRYAKPVTPKDIIALDEDDAAAIATRHLIENHPLFSDGRISTKGTKAIGDDDKVSFTSIITLYECNFMILKELINSNLSLTQATFPMEMEADEYAELIENNNLMDAKLKELRRKGISDSYLRSYYLRKRPDEEVLSKIKDYISDFWIAFHSNLDCTKEYISKEVSASPAYPFRRKGLGGNLLFRPVGLTPFVKAACYLHSNHKVSFSEFCAFFNTTELSIQKDPWLHVLWNPNTSTMEMGSKTLTYQMLVFLFKPEYITKDKSSFLKSYADKTAYKGNHDTLYNNLLYIREKALTKR